MRDGVLEVDALRYELRRYGRVLVVAIGKAAGTMTAAFLRQAGAEAVRFEGIVAGFYEMGEWPAGFRFFRSGHPSPNEASVEAARAILAALQGLTKDDLVIFLISGGGSSMVELFSDPTISLETMAATHRALVECGAPIPAMNAVRKHLSAVKGGRLAAAAQPAEQLTIFVSDVPLGQLDALASGPTLRTTALTDDVYRIAETYRLTDRLPPAVREMIVQRQALLRRPSEATPSLRVLTGACCSIAHRWRRRRRLAHWNWAGMSKSTTAAMTGLLKTRRNIWLIASSIARTRNRVCLLSAGEITVRVPGGASGKGGRNQHFALLCSERIAGGEITVLSGGSDGIDGNSPAAGAVVDGTTEARAQQAGYPVAAALAAFDAYSLLEKLGDAVMTGPTGNNLRDLRVLLLD